MRLLFATVRLVAGVTALVAVMATFFATAAKGPINPFNFFGFFTLQSNIAIGVALVALAVLGFLRRPQSPAFLILRGCVTAYIVIVGIVYNTLLTGTEGGVPLPWANWILHVLIPIYGILDWVLFADRPPLPWKRFWYVLIYPILWCVVVLIRGATDGWVPYPFLSPAHGYGIVLVYVLGIAVAVAVTGVAVWALSRLRLLGSNAHPAR